MMIVFTTPPREMAVGNGIGLFFVNASFEIEHHIRNQQDV